MFTIIDPNISVKTRQVMMTPYIDIAEAMAVQYFSWRYGGRISLGFGTETVKPVEVQNELGIVVAKFGFADRPAVVRL